MRIRSLSPILMFTMTIAVSVRVMADTQWGPWMPLNDGNENGVKIAFKKFPNGTQYYKLRNDYLGAVVVHCSFRFTTMDGKLGKEDGCDGTLAPGQEKTAAGWFDFGVRDVDYGSLSARVSSAGDSSAIRSLEFGGNAAPNKPLHTPDQFQSLSLSGNPPASFGSDLQAGQRTSMYKDGPHEVNLYVWQYYQQDARLCPASPGGSSSGQQFALFQQDAVDNINVENGNITHSVVHKETHFLKCIPASDTGAYPRWRPEIHFHGNTNAVGDRG